MEDAHKHARAMCHGHGTPTPRGPTAGTKSRFLSLINSRWLRAYTTGRPIWRAMDAKKPVSSKVMR